jgi:hypothetical protein
VTARAVIKAHTPTSSPPLPFNAKFVDYNKPRIAQRVIIGGVSTSINSPQAVKDSLARRARLAKESAERKAKRNQPVKNPWSDERKASAALKRSLEVREAYQAYWDKPTTGIEPTERQKQLVGNDLTREEREHRDKYADEIIPGQEPWALAKRYAVSRAKNGYLGFAGDLAGGKYPINHDFTETWLRSTLSPVLQRFAMATPAPGKHRPLPDGTLRQTLMAGTSKSDRAEYWGKLQALDQPYITLLAVLRGGFRKELDRDFASFDELKSHIDEKIRKRRLPCRPHVVVGHEDESGRLIHPHLWWWLPEDSEVWDDLSDKRCKKECITLFDSVVNGCYLELRDLGADAGGLANVLDGKNPLSPQWSFEVWNETIFPSLKEWAQCVQIWHRRNHLVREQAIITTASGLSPEQSNQVFTDSSAMAWEILDRAAGTGIDAFRNLLDDRRALATWLVELLYPSFAHIYDPKKKIRGLLRYVARYVAASWGLHKQKSNGRRRGIGYDFVRNIKHRDATGKIDDDAVLERKAVGGKISAAMKKAATIDAIVTAMELLAESDMALTIENAAPLVDRHPKTVVRNWEDSWAAYHAGTVPDFRCLLKGEHVNPAILESSPSTAPVIQSLDEGTLIRGWPGGGYNDQSASPVTLPSFVSETAIVDPCSPSIDGVQHGTASHCQSATIIAPCPPSTERALYRQQAVDTEGNASLLQRTIPPWITQERNPVQARAGGGDHASGSGRGYVTGAGPRQSYATCGRRDPAIGISARWNTDLQQRWNPETDQQSRQRDAEHENLTPANR